MIIFNNLPIFLCFYLFWATFLSLGTNLSTAYRIEAMIQVQKDNDR